MPVLFRCFWVQNRLDPPIPCMESFQLFQRSEASGEPRRSEASLLDELGGSRPSDPSWSLDRAIQVSSTPGGPIGTHPPNRGPRRSFGGRWSLSGCITPRPSSTWRRARSWHHRRSRSTPCPRPTDDRRAGAPGRVDGLVTRGELRIIMFLMFQKKYLEKIQSGHFEVEASLARQIFSASLRFGLPPNNEHV